MCSFVRCSSRVKQESSLCALLWSAVNSLTGPPKPLSQGGIPPHKETVCRLVSVGRTQGGGG